MEFKKKCTKCGDMVICNTIHARSSTRYCKKCRKVVSKKAVREAYQKNAENYRRKRRERYRKSKDV